MRRVDWWFNSSTTNEVHSEQGEYAGEMLDDYHELQQQLKTSDSRTAKAVEDAKAPLAEKINKLNADLDATRQSIPEKEKLARQIKWRALCQAAQNRRGSGSR